jgi:EpsI family protein
MKRSFIVSLVLGSLMALSAGSAKLMTPTTYLSKSLPDLNFNTIIPVQIGEWSEEKNGVSQVVNPQSLELVKKIYTQTLSRTYVNGKGERLMLSIAYGADQRDGLQVHYPEVCYPAQGFQVKSKRQSVLKTTEGNIAVTRIETNLTSQRYEPVTYWTTIGDKVVSNGINKKMNEMRYGFNGEIPDGLLFRISTIDIDTVHAFLVQDAFVRSLAQTLAPMDRKRLMGLN